MVDIVDMSFFSNFGVIFTFLLVYAITYGIISYGKPLGKDISKGIGAMVALGVAVLVVMSPQVVSFIAFSIPWFLIIIFILFFIMFMMKLFTGPDADFSKFIFEQKRVVVWIVIAIFIVLLFAFGNSFGQQSLDKGNWDGGDNSDQELSNDETIDSVDEFIGETGVGNAATTGTSVATDDFSTNVVNTLVNPKVLGLILVLLVAVFAIFFLAD